MHDSTTDSLQKKSFDLSTTRPSARVLDFFYLLYTTICEVLFFLGVDRTVFGRERVPRHGAFILLSNHISHFDPPLIGSPLWKRVNWVTARDLYTHPLVIKIFNSLGCIPFDRERRDVSAMKGIIAALRSGEPVGIFPEGGIRHGTNSLLFHKRIETSTTQLAWREKVPVLPAAIVGADGLYSIKSWPKLCRVYVAYGHPISPDDKPTFEQFHAKCEQEFRRLYDELRSRYEISEDYLPRSAQEHWQNASLYLG